MKIASNVTRGQQYAGPVLPAGAEVVGTVRAGALVRLKNGMYVEYAQGETRTLNQREGP